MRNPWDSEETFQAWKNDPQNGPFMIFLHDQVEGLKTLWALGQPMAEADQSRAQTLGDLLDLEWERDILSFYKEEDKDEERNGDTAS
jgi:hypothetical protein|tara:strand:- start:12334 stop:12594 length:261 start_codon:yes stop_codon:yes gene_type:complete